MKYKRMRYHLVFLKSLNWRRCPSLDFPFFLLFCKCLHRRFNHPASMYGQELAGGVLLLFFFFVFFRSGLQFDSFSVIKNIRLQIIRASQYGRLTVHFQSSFHLAFLQVQHQSKSDVDWSKILVAEPVGKRLLPSWASSRKGWTLNC